MPFPRESRCAVGSLSTGGESGRHTHTRASGCRRVRYNRPSEGRRQKKRERERDRDGTKYRLDRKERGGGQKKKIQYPYRATDRDRQSDRRIRKRQRAPPSHRSEFGREEVSRRISGILWMMAMDRPSLAAMAPSPNPRLTTESERQGCALLSIPHPEMIGTWKLLFPKTSRNTSDTSSAYALGLGLRVRITPGRTYTISPPSYINMAFLKGERVCV